MDAVPLGVVSRGRRRHLEPLGALTLMLLKTVLLIHSTVHTVCMYVISLKRINTFLYQLNYILLLFNYHICVFIISSL